MVSCDSCGTFGGCTWYRWFLAIPVELLEVVPGTDGYLAIPVELLDFVPGTAS